MKRRAHLFAVDWLPGGDEVATGGGLRSLQLHQALEAAGFAVTVSVPRNTRRGEVLLREAPERVRMMHLHDMDNQLDLLRELAPDVVVWAWPTLRNVPFAGEAIHVNDLNGMQHFEMAHGAPGSLALTLDRLTRRCRGCDLVLTGSPEQNGYWAGQLSKVGDPPLVLVPYSLPSTHRGAAVGQGSPLRRLHFSGNVYAWNLVGAWLPRVAAWCERRGDVELQVVAGFDPGGSTDLQTINNLRQLERLSSVSFRTEATFKEVLGSYGPGSATLDLYEDTLERRLAVPIRTVNALQHGLPVLMNVQGTTMREVRRAGAGLMVAGDVEGGLEAALDALAGLTASGFGAMSRAASAFAAHHFDERASQAALIEGIDQAMRVRSSRTSAWRSGASRTPRLGHVLAISDEGANLRDLRVTMPLDALHRERLIEGYSVWTDGRIASSTRSRGADAVFDAIWVQRRLEPEMALALHQLGRPFVLDADDNLMVSPLYRSAFSPAEMQSARVLARDCTVLTTPSSRLVELLQRHASTTLIDKAILCPNLTASPMRPAVPPGEPRCVVWASSDMPALTGAHANVVRAVRDFCAMGGLRLVCVGAQPPPLLTGSEVELEHFDMLPYGAYLALLASLAPAIMVCPLETAGDALTQDFVDGKSDIKMLEAASSGLVGVFSAAKPYLDTDLPKAIVTDNSYRGWFDALMRARQSCVEGAPAAELPPARVASRAGLRPWVDAIARVQLQQPLALSELEGALRLTRSRHKRQLLTELEFDETWYLGKYPDVRVAMDEGRTDSAYSHYVYDGYRENRLGHAEDEEAPAQDQFWLNLRHTVSDLRQSVENRSMRLEEIRARRALRQPHRRPGR